MASIIIAHTENNFGIGLDGKLPWNIPEDLKSFKHITTRMPNSVLIMGRKTAESIGKYPLFGRVCISISKNQKDSDTEYIVFTSIIEALHYTYRFFQKSEIFFIGGAQLLKTLISFHPNIVKRIYTTEIRMNDLIKCDTFIPELGTFIDEFFQVESRSEWVNNMFRFNVFNRNNSKCENQSEQLYLNCLQILLTTPPRQTRNAVTRSRFGSSLSFDLRNGFPLLTTKRVFWRAIVYELLFFLSGKTDSNWLVERGVNIWRLNTSREFLDTNGKECYVEGDLGPMYGWQWRHFGAVYCGKNEDYEKLGLDQFREVIENLIMDPHSRRILMTSYNPSQAEEGVLYPCHGLTIQFFADQTDRTISLQMYQRSGDFFLGVPFNIASYALLLHIVVNLVNQRSEIIYVAGNLTLIFGDYHLYEDHIVAAVEQICRNPRPFPRLQFTHELKSYDPKYFATLSPDSFKIYDYEAHPTISCKMIA